MSKITNNHAIQAKRDCPHLVTNFDTNYEFNRIDYTAPCKTCGNVADNSVCLKCFEVHCNQGGKGHMTEHENKVHHKIILKFSDVSVWCYGCNSSLSHISLDHVLNSIHKKKFGRPIISSHPDDLKEIIEQEESIREKVKVLAQWIIKSKHFVIFTGAGISTSAGIPDFRGPDGVWTLQAEGKLRTRPTTSILKAIPTPTHMAILELERMGYLKFLISQNTDGLHRRSGIAPNKLAEVHGNTNLEICGQCGKNFLRDYSTRTTCEVHNHKTGRTCNACGGDLLDSIINFGEILPQKPFQDSCDHSKDADVHLVLGSSLRATTVAGLPKITHQKGGKLVVCNLQVTPLDSDCDLRIFAKSDDFMKYLMEELQISIPHFILRRHILIKNGNDSIVKIEGIDVDGTPISLFKGVYINNQKAVFDNVNTHYLKMQDVDKVKIKVEFVGHYFEPDLEIDYVLSNKPTNYELNYDFRFRTWDVKIIN